MSRIAEPSNICIFMHMNVFMIKSLKKKKEIILETVTNQNGSMTHPLGPGTHSESIVLHVYPFGSTM